jgi:hypothetical protein
MPARVFTGLTHHSGVIPANRLEKRDSRIRDIIPFLLIPEQFDKNLVTTSKIPAVSNPREGSSQPFATHQDRLVLLLRNGEFFSRCVHIATMVAVGSGTKPLDYKTILTYLCSRECQTQAKPERTVLIRGPIKRKKDEMNNKKSNSGIQCLIEIFQDILNVLGSYRKPYKIGSHSGFYLLFCSQLLVGRRRGMNDQAL